MRRRFACLFVFLALSVTGASAHMALPGMGNVVNGLVHPLATPTHVFIMLAVGLAMGAKKLKGLNVFFAFFIPATAIGLALSPFVSGQVPNLVLALLGLATSANLALALPTDRPFHRVIGVIAGFIVGLDSTPEPTLVWWGQVETLLSTLVSVTVITADLAFYTSVLPPYQWIQVGFRVAGSWLFAISLLVFAFSVRSLVH